MSAASRPRRVEVTAHAKLNLGLAVGPLRGDGFHELLTVFQSVSLADTLLAERSARGFSLRVSHEEAAVRGRQGAAAVSVHHPDLADRSWTTSSCAPRSACTRRSD